MNKIILIISCFFLVSMTCTESIYTHSLITIEGQIKPMADFQGKKILIITLPIQQNASNDSLLNSIDSLRAAHAGSLVVIAVPAYEDGYTASIKNQLKDWYRTKLNTAIIITEGLYTRKTSGSQQDPLFQWLTDKTKNGNLNQDVSGERNKFFVWTDGQLLAALGAKVKIGGAAINNLIE
jgi:glutathione peroxidase